MLNPLGFIFSFVIALVGGFFGLVANGADFGIEGPTLQPFVLVIGFYVIVSLMIGVLAGKYWKISILSSWGSVLFGFPGFLVAIEKGHVRYAAYYFTGLFIVPLICLLLGYSGSILSPKLVGFFRGEFLRTSGMARTFEILAYVWFALFAVYFLGGSTLFILVYGFGHAVQSAIMYSWQYILALTPGILLLILSRHLEKRKSTPKP